MNKCSEIMTKNPICCVPTDTANKLAQLMAAEDIGPVLIVDDQHSRRLTGIVTDRDLALKVVAEGRDPKQTRAQEVMTRDVMTVHADDDVQTALDLMTQWQVRRIPVVDGSDRLVGILAQADVATRFDKPAKTAEVVKGISETRNLA